MVKHPVILNKTTVAKSRLFCIEALQIQFSNGQLRHYERLAKCGASYGAVLVSPMLDKDTVLLIKEYSAGLHRYEVGLPKGKVDAGETFLEAANRELKEEIGYGAQRLQHLTTFSMAPSYLEHTTEIILAEQLYAEKLMGDEPEELEIIPWPIANINELIATGNCSEARSIAALFLAKEFMLQAK